MLVFKNMRVSGRRYLMPVFVLALYAVIGASSSYATKRTHSQEAGNNIVTSSSSGLMDIGPLPDSSDPAHLAPNSSVMSTCNNSSATSIKKRKGHGCNAIRDSFLVEFIPLVYKSLGVSVAYRLTPKGHVLKIDEAPDYFMGGSDCMTAMLYHAKEAFSYEDYNTFAHRIYELADLYYMSYSRHAGGSRKRDVCKKEEMRITLGVTGILLLRAKIEAGDCGRVSFYAVNNMGSIFSEHKKRGAPLANAQDYLNVLYKSIMLGETNDKGGDNDFYRINNSTVFSTLHDKMYKMHITWKDKVGADKKAEIKTSKCHNYTYVYEMISSSSISNSGRWKEIKSIEEGGIRQDESLQESEDLSRPVEPLQEPEGEEEGECLQGPGDEDDELLQKPGGEGGEFLQKSEELAISAESPQLGKDLKRPYSKKLKAGLVAGTLALTGFVWFIKSFYF
ncbi:MAG: hypothetical protein QS748_09750 [Candidatus Endonucleobacter bathymodioli]|uniref:Uncharacterized protein n=1 Tax=Candidatus Endonucleibacter bathymodioli TaxID=539814 RepID=A0AA90NRW2_9GAMM|nr:hypothetical protein [Candidatus Endonucleobacter bathymodioli]